MDILHQAYLSVFKTIIDILWGITLASINSKILSSLDQCLFCIKKHSRYPSFQILGTNKGGYFSSNANFATFEQRFVMQVLSILHLVNILVGAFWILKGSLWLPWNMCGLIVFMNMSFFKVLFKGSPLHSIEFGYWML